MNKFLINWTYCCVVYCLMFISMAKASNFAVKEKRVVRTTKGDTFDSFVLSSSSLGVKGNGDVYIVTNHYDKSYQVNIKTKGKWSRYSQRRKGFDELSVVSDDDQCYLYTISRKGDLKDDGIYMNKFENDVWGKTFHTKVLSLTETSMCLKCDAVGRIHILHSARSNKACKDTYILVNRE